MLPFCPFPSAIPLAFSNQACPLHSIPSLSGVLHSVHLFLPVVCACLCVSSANKQCFAPLRNAGCTIHQQVWWVQHRCRNWRQSRPLANFCRLVQHAESHEEALECFTTSVPSGNTAEAERILADLDSLSPTIQSSIAADLMAAISDARAELRVHSLACKMHNVRVPDEPFMDRLLAVLDDLSSWPSRLLHACLVHGAIHQS